jgi:hypothetical protein
MSGAPEACNREQADLTERPDGVVVRRLVRGDLMDVTEYTAPRGFTTGASDSEVSEKVGYVVRGTVEITSGAGTLVVTAGGAYTVPCDLPQQFTVTDDAVIVQVRCPQSPARI